MPVCIKGRVQSDTVQVGPLGKWQSFLKSNCGKTHNIYHFIHFITYSSVALSICTLLCNLYHYTSLGFFNHSKLKLCIH